MATIPTRQAITDAPSSDRPVADGPGRTGRYGRRRVRRAIAVLALGATAASAAVGSSAGSAGALTGVRLYATHSWLNVAVAEGSTRPGARIIQWTYTGGAEQAWNVPDRGTTGEVRNIRSGLCVTTDGIKGHGLFQDRCDGRAEQQWASVRVWHAGFIPSAVRYHNNATGLDWDVQGYSTTRGANIVGWSWKSDNVSVLNQLFTEV